MGIEEMLKKKKNNQKPMFGDIILLKFASSPKLFFIFL